MYTHSGQPNKFSIFSILIHGLRYHVHMFYRADRYRNAMFTIGWVLCMEQNTTITQCGFIEEFSINIQVIRTVYLAIWKIFVKYKKR